LKNEDDLSFEQDAEHSRIAVQSNRLIKYLYQTDQCIFNYTVLAEKPDFPLWIFLHFEKQMKCGFTAAKMDLKLILEEP